MSLSNRLARLEKALRERMGDDCQCETRQGISGWRIVYDDARFGGVSDLVETCAKCGRERPVILVTYDWTDQTKELQR